MRWPIKIERSSFGPYGSDWWGFKIFTRNAGGETEYTKALHLEISLGTKMGHDGYQKSRIAHIYGLYIFYGKPLPADPDDVRIGDKVTCFNDEDTVQLREGNEYEVKGIIFKVINGKKYKYLEVPTGRGTFAYELSRFKPRSTEYED